MIPILIVIPFWSGDQGLAIQLCRIIAGLQNAHAGNTANVLLVSRQDCKEDPNMVKIISPKFNTLTYKSQSPLKGWPAGANGIFGSSMIHISNVLGNKYECVYWMEPDCVPIRPNWFWDLVLTWRKRHPTCKIIGHRSDCDGNGKGDHITGCSIYDPNIARILPEITRCDNVAWDYLHRNKIVRIGGSTNLIQNRYRQTNLPPGVIEEPGVVIIHGTKDNSVVNAVARKYNIKLH